MPKFCSVILLVFLSLWGISSALADDAGGKPAPIKFKQDTLFIHTAADNKNIKFTVEIAATQEQWELGLMHRTSLAEDHGMLFIFDREMDVQMWMKDTLLSLDMLFIDNQGKIIYIAPKTKPESLDLITAKGLSKAVLELGAGIAEKNGIKVGDRLHYPLSKP